MGYQLFKNLKLLKRIRKENSVAKLLEFLIYEFLNKRKLFSLYINGEDVNIRTSTTDLVVSISSLFGEFRTVANAFPKNHKGLIIDAGGYIGTAAIALARLYPNATIISIEPSTDNFAILKRNVKKIQNVHIINAALMPNSVSGSIQLMNRGTGNWGFTVIEKPQDAAASFIEQVNAVSIDEILKRYGADGIMLFKMDIEGGEYTLFTDGDWLEKTDVLMIELHERIVIGCENAFNDANKNRYVYKEEGEKYISIGKCYFS